MEAILPQCALLSARALLPEGRGQMEQGDGWYPDPSGRNEQVYFSQGRPTHKYNNGVVEEYTETITEFGSQTLTTSPSDAASSPQAVTPPGWYPDPYNGDLVRFWDGAQWTAETRQQAVGPTAAVPIEQASQPSPASQEWQPSPGAHASPASQEWQPSPASQEWQPSSGAQASPAWQGPGPQGAHAAQQGQPGAGNPNTGQAPIVSSYQPQAASPYSRPEEAFGHPNQQNLNQQNLNQQSLNQQSPNQQSPNQQGRPQESANQIGAAQATQASQTPAGWYPDPSRQGGERYWDGAAWTQHYRSASTKGPVGKIRNPWAVIGLSIVTLGIYGLYWQYATFKEMKDYSGVGIGGGLGLLLAFLVGIVNAFLMPSEVGNIYASEGREKPVSGTTGFWIFLPIAGAVVLILKTQGALNRLWEAHGATKA